MKIMDKLKSQRAKYKKNAPILVIATFVVLALSLKFANSLASPIVSSSETMVTIQCSSGFVGEMAWSPDSDLFACSGEDSEGGVWYADTWRLYSPLQEHRNNFLSLAWHPSGKFLATMGLTDNLVAIWDKKTTQTIAEYHTDVLDNILQTARFSKVRWDTSGNKLASIPIDQGTIQIWDFTTGNLINSFPTGVAVDWSPNGSRLAIADTNDHVRLWDVATAKQLFDFQSPSQGIATVAWSPDQEKLAIGGTNGQVYIWNTSSGNLENTLLNPNIDSNLDLTKSFQVVWSSDGKRLASATTTNLSVWSIDNQQLLINFNVSIPQKLNPSRLRWSPKNDIVLISGETNNQEVLNGRILIWDITTGRILADRDHDSPSPLVIINSDETLIAVSNANGSINIWNLSDLTN